MFGPLEACSKSSEYAQLQLCWPNDDEIVLEDGRVFARCEGAISRASSKSALRFGDWRRY